jgi:hypothetical protein
MASTDPKYGENLVHLAIGEADNLSEETVKSLENRYKLVFVAPTKAYYTKLHKLVSDGIKADLKEISSSDQVHEVKPAKPQRQVKKEEIKESNASPAKKEEKENGQSSESPQGNTDKDHGESSSDKTAASNDDSSKRD